MPADTPIAPTEAAARHAVRAATHAGDGDALDTLFPAAEVTEQAQARIARTARRLVEGVRTAAAARGGVETFLSEFGLSTKEGVILMCLAEALLRIPDAATVDRLIRDKIGGAEWEAHLGRSDSLFVNASTWALMLTGRLVREPTPGDAAGAVRSLLARAGEPVVRAALTQAMRVMARQFVMGRTIDEAIERGAEAPAKGYRHSYDMLGEAAHTAADAVRYAGAYGEAIDRLGKTVEAGDIHSAPGVSIKLSALHPRFEYAQHERVMDEMPLRLTALARQARAAGVGLTIDAEEADRLELTLDVYAALLAAPDLAGWPGLGLVVQSCQKRAMPVIGWLAIVAARRGVRIPVRLVKGAYWDSEIKRAQEGGFADYPVFIRKAATDVSYLACAQRLLAAPDRFHAQFATHNAHTVASILEFAGERRDFEFQRLHGMGEDLYSQIVDPAGTGLACRVYGPVGSHEDLLPYLVRRLLENGANTSFVHRVVDRAVPIEGLIADPVPRARALARKTHPAIPLPPDIYLPERRNSLGLDLSDPLAVAKVEGALAGQTLDWSAAPSAGARGAATVHAVSDPADRRRIVGHVHEAAAADVSEAVERASSAWRDWDTEPAESRAAILEALAESLEAERLELIALCVREAGKTLPDAVSEVREAADFCRYYAARARADFAGPVPLPGPTGERNELSLRGRGVFACISPWNFPLAIFLGQVSAGLAAGNVVIAKPAEQTPLIAAAAVRLAHRAGIPADVLQILPGTGDVVGAALTADERIAGVAFTGSVEVAHAINRALAARDGPIVPLIAETGGQNAMIVDSSALPEQVVPDALTSAFRSAGQRCSALRVLFVQDDIGERLIAMLLGAMEELAIGDPARLATDVGPLIDAAAREALQAHVERIRARAVSVHTLDLPADCEHGTFFAPHVIEIDDLGLLTGEVFGPVLHVIRYAADRLDAVVAQVNATGFGLTLGVHSRIDATVERIFKLARVGNTYVNRNMIGAVVGVQPFGGQGLSGTGPKAGGPRYLHRFAIEKTLSVNTAAAGGNAALLAQDEDE